MGSVSCSSCIVYDYILSPKQWSIITLSCLLSLSNSLWWPFSQSITAFFSWKESSIAALSQGELCTRRQSECMTDHSIPGNLFQVSKISVLNKHKDWKYLLSLLSCMATKIIIPSHQREFYFVLKKYVVENKSCSSCSHNCGRSQPPQYCIQGFSFISLICSSMQFLLLQAQLMYLFLSDVLIASVSEILVQGEISFQNFFVLGWSCQGKTFTSPGKGGKSCFCFCLITGQILDKPEKTLWQMPIHRHYWGVSFVHASSWFTFSPEEVIRKIS